MGFFVAPAKPCLPVACGVPDRKPLQGLVATYNQLYAFSEAM